jgi:hypothetical protein
LVRGLKLFIPTLFRHNTVTPSNGNSSLVIFVFSFPSASKPVINAHFDVSRIPETSKSAMSLNPANDWNAAQRLNDWNVLQCVEFAARKASNIRAVGLSMKSKPVPFSSPD